MWPMLLNGVDHARALVCPLLSFAIVEWHQVDRVVMQLGASQHIPLRPLNIDVMHRHDGRWGRGEWYPRFLRGLYDMWHDRAQSRLALEMVVGGVKPSRQYLRWYYQWAHLYLVGHKDPAIPIPGVIPPFSRMGYRTHHTWCNLRMWAWAWRWESCEGSRAYAGGAVDDDVVDFDPAMTAADYLSIGLGVPSHPYPDTPAGLSHQQTPMFQAYVQAPFDQPQSSHVFYPQASTPNVDHAPENYTLWVADMTGQSSHQPPSAFPCWGIPIQHTEPFAHMSQETPPTVYEPRRTEPSESSSCDEH
ncbi:hypothetical protein PIB30_057465 [Stylosanthes scabra]|uniref:Aminotransferase-like plant mobile domain-containing protein n=1 Tax=Stylosanthes scabra TaxID=79078 RepID=A0ABU6QKE6_9FABA|nr:hypothetical protein [Stylosanthes scabra]